MNRSALALLLCAVAGQGKFRFLAHTVNRFGEATGSPEDAPLSAFHRDHCRAARSRRHPREPRVLLRHSRRPPERQRSARPRSSTNTIRNWYLLTYERTLDASLSHCARAWNGMSNDGRHALDVAGETAVVGAPAA